MSVFCGLFAADAKAVALDAELKYCQCQRRDAGAVQFAQVNQELGASEVLVTIGLFTIIKLFRLVNLTVESRGFCVPRECEEITTNPCEYFESLQFPLNIFEPPSREDFRSSGVLGISEREEREEREERRNCRCDRP